MLQPGLPRAVVRALDAGMVGGSATKEDCRGEAVGPGFAGLAEQAVSASAAATAASRHGILTYSTVSRPGRPAESQQARRYSQAPTANV
jgi:hypothetical protein